MNRIIFWRSRVRFTIRYLGKLNDIAVILVLLKTWSLKFSWLMNNTGLNCMDTYTWIFFNKYIGKFWETCKNLKNLFSSLLYNTVNDIAYKICVNQQFILLVRFLVNRKLLIKCWGYQVISYMWIFYCEGVGFSNSCVIQESAVCITLRKLEQFLLLVL